MTDVHKLDIKEIIVEMLFPASLLAGSGKTQNQEKQPQTYTINLG